MIKFQARNFLHWGFEDQKKGFAFWAVEFYLKVTDEETVPRGQIGSWEDPFLSSLQYLRDVRVSEGLCDLCSHAYTRNVKMQNGWVTRSILHGIDSRMQLWKCIMMHYSCKCNSQCSISKAVSCCPCLVVLWQRMKSSRKIAVFGIDTPWAKSLFP